MYDEKRGYEVDTIHDNLYTLFGRGRQRNGRWEQENERSFNLYLRVTSVGFSFAFSTVPMTGSALAMTGSLASSEEALPLEEFFGVSRSPRLGEVLGPILSLLDFSCLQNHIR